MLVTIDAFRSETRCWLSMPEMVTPHLNASTYSKKVYSMEWSTVGEVSMPLLLPPSAGAKKWEKLVPKTF